ncbi:MAG: carbohydrate ABC transporter permease [Lachnospiraceae bacterium]|jgi:putative aldouronate transport system permease protein
MAVAAAAARKETHRKGAPRSKGEKGFTIVSYVCLIIFALLILIPLLYIFQLTFSANPDTSFRIIPQEFTLNNYKYVFENNLIQRPFLNSCFVTVCYLAVSMTLSVCMAYPISRKELKGRNIFNFIVVFPMLFSLGFLPKYFLVRDLGLLNTYASLIFPAAMNTFNIIVLRNFFEGIPNSLVESARIDGASELTILRKIILPLSKAALATVGLFYMVQSWNSYQDVLLYINDTSKQTLQLVLRTMVMENSMDSSSLEQSLIKNVQYTTIVVALLPIMVVYPFMQRYFVKGVMIGSVKE